MATFLLVDVDGSMRFERWAGSAALFGGHETGKEAVFFAGMEQPHLTIGDELDFGTFNLRVLFNAESREAVNPVYPSLSKIFPSPLRGKVGLFLSWGTGYKRFESPPGDKSWIESSFIFMDEQGVDMIRNKLGMDVDRHSVALLNATINDSKKNAITINHDKYLEIVLGYLESYTHLVSQYECLLRESYDHHINVRCGSAHAPDGFMARLRSQGNAFTFSLRKRRRRRRRRQRPSSTPVLQSSTTSEEATAEKDDDEEEVECCICLDEKEEEELSTSFGCTHLFHTSCATRWRDTCSQKSLPTGCPYRCHLP